LFTLDEQLKHYAASVPVPASPAEVTPLRVPDPANAQGELPQDTDAVPTDTASVNLGGVRPFRAPMSEADMSGGK
jgi:hypothetical protein